MDNATIESLWRASLLHIIEAGKRVIFLETGLPQGKSFPRRVPKSELPLFLEPIDTVS